MKENEYDLIVVGGGCAGYPAAVYASRFNLKTLVIAKEQGGLITTTHLVENYPGFISISGPELGKKLEEQVIANNVRIENDIVESIKKDDNYYTIKTSLGEKNYKTKTIILATGTKHRHLDAIGEKEFSGKGVSYCATCDGMFFKNKVVCIIGGGDSSVKEAMVLAQNSSKVYILARTTLKAEPINADRIRKNPKVEIIEGVEVKEICGEKFVTHAMLNNGKKIETAGVFISVGMLPQNDLAKELNVTLNPKGEIIIDSLSKTNVEGVFAAGDVTNSVWKQGIIASSQGSIAAYSAYEYIQSKFDSNVKK